MSKTQQKPLSAFRVNYAGSSKSKAQDLPDPIGFTDSDAVSKKQSKSKSASAVAQQRADPAALKMAKAWELAYSPAKSLPMNAIMLYMSGSGVQIFSMMAVGMLITGPLRGISTMNSAFDRLSSPGQSLLLPKVLFILCQLAGIVLGLYKCWSMGLLPTETSDWLAWRQPRTPLEFSPIH
ncbi:related to EMC4 - member of a transmembrane complex required for efficient folding of proteins in the ER [Ustilago trichophora]|uniref:ER membrane protein complex subunit 4 n=1 Tax=Ustilago trichophora TaxID=86804 RepID=A0A5C3DZI6_9BASI|nr:related to EMC4 - member of a transmembrane complex required for efficient folding of proteins in the ER [Ustilago trichophora]